MANLKRNMIELVTGVEDGEVKTKKYMTTPFIPLSAVYEALDLAKMIDDPKTEDRDKTEKLITFVADTLYAKQFTQEELTNGLHGPEAFELLYAQLLFTSNGYQSDETKKFLAKKR